MNKLFVIFCGVMFHCSMLSQNLRTTEMLTETVKTPYGTTVPDTYVLTNGQNCIYTSEELSAISSHLYNYYDGATIVGENDYRYNCHAYAWHVSEGGSKVWIGRYSNTAEDVYWNDSSYIEVPESEATKVSYHQDGNHSAIKISAEWYQSKWGATFLVKHKLNEVFCGNYIPYLGGTNYHPELPKRFYRKRNNQIIGESLLCDGSASFYITEVPSDCLIAWSIDNSHFSISSYGNQCSMIYTGSDDYDSVNLTANVYRNNNLIKQFTKTIMFGTPEFWADLQITGGDGIQGRWTSNLIRNRVDIEELFDIPIHYYQFEANLYRMSDSDPYDTLVRHWFFNNRYAVMDYIPQGWYLLQVRGVNSCGVSEWLEVEIECIDTYMPHANDDETVMSFTYNKQGQILTVTVNHATASSQKTASLAQSRSTMGNTCVLQLWNESRLVKEYNSKASIVQIPMAGLKNGVYTIRYVSKDKVIAKKFVKP